MSHAVGDSVWIGTTHVGFDGLTRSHVLRAEVVAVIDGTTMVRFPASGIIRAHETSIETLRDTESDAWAAVARELAQARDRVQAAIDEATAKAAGSRVGEAVAS
jgi:hypothetical protein